MSDPVIAARPAHAGYRRLAANSLATLAGRSAAIVCSFVLATVFFRVLGRELFGLWSLFAALVGYSVLVDFGLSASVERRVAVLAAAGRDAEIPHAVQQALLVIAIAAGLAEAAVVIVLAAPWPAAWPARSLGVAQGLVAAPAVFALMAASLVVSSGLGGLQRMVALHAWRTLGMILGTSVAIGLALSGVRRLDALLLGFSAGAPLTAIGQWWHLRRHLRHGNPNRSHGIPGLWSREAWKELLQFGGTLQLATLAPFCGDYAFRVIVGARFGVEFSGVYDLGARAAYALRSVVSSLFIAMVPFGVSLVATEERMEASRLIQLAVRYTALAMLPASALLVLFAPPLVRVWLGDGPVVDHVVTAVRLLTIAHALTALTVPIAMIGRSAGVPGPEAVTAWMGVIAGVAASVVAMTFSGAVAAFAIGPLFGGLVAWWWLVRRLRIRFASGRDLTLAAMLVAAVLAVAAGALLAAQLIGLPAWLATLLAGAIGAAAAAAGAWRSGLVGSAEYSLLLSLRPTGRRA